jgi:branched-chain amino acid transport system substrate-binding protein
MDCYISRVVNGKLTLQKKVSKEDLLKNMPVRHNLSAMPV